MLGKLIHIIDDPLNKKELLIITRVDEQENAIYRNIFENNQESYQKISNFFPKICKIINFGKVQYYELEHFMGNIVDNMDGIRLDLN